MAAISVISDYVRISHTKFFEAPAGDDTAGEPYLLLSFVYNIDGERLENDRAESRHKFSECNSASLRAFVEEMEPIPLDVMVDPQTAETDRDMIADMIASLVRDCAGIQGLKILRVNIIAEIDDEEGDFDSIESNVSVDQMINREEDIDSIGSDDGEDFDFMELDDEEFVGESRMNLLRKNVYMGGAEVNEVCIICLDEMRVGEEVVWTPCVHRFHGVCIDRWFENNGLCPLCRFKMEPF